MSTPAIARTTEAGFELASPAVGTFTPARRDGQIVEAGDELGILRILNREVSVVVPECVSGRLLNGVTERGVPVAYGSLMFSVEPSELAANTVSVGDATQHGTVVRAQMDGQFYQRPSPEEPTFVSVGERIGPGTKIGLIEVMKFFYPVVYEGVGEVTITELIAGDSAPVEAGDGLIAVE
ncbi:MAG: biotin carboxyl carrier protein [Bradymonadia bacterium]|jgi:biotin carboxyl carrier protein